MSEPESAPPASGGEGDEASAGSAGDDAEAVTLVARPSRLSQPPAEGPGSDPEGVTRSGEREKERPVAPVSRVADLDAPTGPSLGATAASTRGTAGSLVQSSREFLHQDDVDRIHVFSAGMLVVCVAGALCLAFLPGDPIATRWGMVGLAILWVGFARVWWTSRQAATYAQDQMGWVALVLSGASAFMAYYFGVFSPFPSVVALAIYTYSLGAPFRFALGVYATAALGQGLLGMLVSLEVVPDRGLVAGHQLAMETRIVAQAAVQLVYAIAFLVGRASARRTRETVRALEGAVRQVAAREALLREARAELERAAGIGEPGRFTEQRLGAFELGVVIGRGGMGEIYAATHVETGEPAAVKLLQRGALHAEADPLERFEREARLVASLESPHVVRVLEIGGVEAPLPYLAMELLVGHDLAWYLRERRRLKPAQVVDLVRDVAAGLEVARGKRIVHRDLKPQNLFRAEGGEGARWKILDFGVSRLAGEPGTLTAGHLVGTPAYMAPEQARGSARIDHRVDVYALGVIAYRALTGRPAFTGKDVPRLVSAVVGELPPAPSEVVDVPESVDAVLRVALAKAPGDRFETAAALADAFEAAVDGEVAPSLEERAARLNDALAWS
ncbi:MAG TPA: protein kinase [Polyangiaceae bacterium LLY-WYZ-15_(1-7)]|nr:protein kinase [Polyangiaceae bacterium LLY-WYZ-15_(1-7)]HJL07965.1 protein kinase [Polyangiaceae bacterium LLY-WYZ-15_(1-7)]HJL26960.1 protein kinase [Polyangiaceae bacterium LLY-WYZ-15_(1-7)]HJL45331.1 protein kinase [Polyangiaceae bacterium LLY-WYZ-15_(1-7)]